MKKDRHIRLFLSSLELRLNNDKLSTLYCSQCMSSTHEKGIFTHLYNHHG